MSEVTVSHERKGLVVPPVCAVVAAGGSPVLMRGCGMGTGAGMPMPMAGIIMPMGTRVGMPGMGTMVTVPGGGVERAMGSTVPNAWLPGPIMGLTLSWLRVGG